jgi:hypothetical protein
VVEVSDAQWRALEALERFPDGLTATHFGERLWGRGRAGRLPQAWCRPAARMLGLLKEKGLVFERVQEAERWRWRLWMVRVDWRQRCRIKRGGRPKHDE